MKDIKHEIYRVFDGAGEYIDETRKNAIVFSVMKRIDTLKSIATLNRQTVDKIENDIEEDIAEDYVLKMD